MHASARRLAAALALSALLCGCQLFGGSTQVRFQNGPTSGFVVAAVQFGALADGNPLPPGATTGYFPVMPGQSPLTAESQAGSWSNPVLFTIVAGHSYTVTFSGASFSAMTVTLAADN